MPGARAWWMVMVMVLGSGFALSAPRLVAQSAVPRAAVGGQPASTALATPTTPTTPATSAIRSGLLVRPDTVRIGDPFELVVSVVVPIAARVEWPAITDTAAVVAMREPTHVESDADGVQRRETATYALAAWDVGALPIGLPDATVHVGATSLSIPMTSARVFVRSVLPADTMLRVPKPAKGLFAREIPWWERWWPALLVVAALLLLWWYMSRRRRTQASVPRHDVDIYARALHDFERLDRAALLDAGERGRAVALATDIMRVYLAARIPPAALSMTSAELLLGTADDDRVPQSRLTTLLAESDAIKFARRAVPQARAITLMLEARAVVDATEAAHAERVVAAAAAAAEATANAEAARDAEQEAARRRSRNASSHDHAGVP